MNVSDSYRRDYHVSILNKLKVGEIATARFGDISLDISSQSVAGPAGSVRLSDSEYQILWLLVKVSGNYVSTSEIIYFLYQDKDSDVPISNVVPVFVARLKEKLLSIKSETKIESARDYGYQVTFVG